MSGWTNRGKLMALKRLHDGEPMPANYYVALVTNAVPPTADTNTMGELTEIASGNGYSSGGIQLALNTTDFDVAVEDDVSDLARVQIRDLVWTASGGAIPSSGNGARWAVLLDDHVTLSSREVYYFWDLTVDRSAPDGQTITLQNCEMRIAEG